MNEHYTLLEHHNGFRFGRNVTKKSISILVTSSSSKKSALYLQEITENEVAIKTTSFPVLMISKKMKSKKK
jgi:hypothetical protein